MDIDPPDGERGRESHARKVAGPVSLGFEVGGVAGEADPRRFWDLGVPPGPQGLGSAGFSLSGRAGCPRGLKLSPVRDPEIPDIIRYKTL